MRKIMAALMMVLGFTFLSAQTVESAPKTAEYQTIDKNTDLAMIYDQDGKLIEKGVMFKGKRHGVWQAYDSQGVVIAEVNFEHGKKNGIWKIYDDADLVYVLYYKNDKKVMAEDLAAAR